MLCAAVITVLAAPAWADAAPAHHQRHVAARADRAGIAPSGSEPLKVIGNLPEPIAGKQRSRQGHIAQIDAPARRMYYIYADQRLVDHVVTFDLRPRIPRPIANGVLAPDIQVPDVSPDVTALDTKRGDLALIGFHLKAGGQVVQSDTPTLLRYDVRHNKALPQWEFEQRLPGFAPYGMTYSRQDDLFYLVGDFSGTSVVSQTNVNGFAPVTTLVALTPDTGKVVWVKPLPQCQQVLNSPHIGALVARSDSRPAIYLACITGGTFAGTVNPGQSGLLRVDIKPRSRSASAAAHFPVEFFPISGQYFNGSQQGIASYDHRRDRLFLQSLSQTTPGAWVFDGRLSAWVGFVSAPDFTDVFSGVNEGLGHLYIGLNTQSLQRAPSDGIIVANASLTPVPAGDFDPLVTSTLITADSGSNRLFVSPAHNETTLKPYLVVVDQTPADVRASTLNFDRLTDGVSESKAAYVDYSADVNGYGADVVLVGGTKGPTSITGNQQNFVPEVVAGGTRGLMLAHVSGIGLRPAGASASAQGVTADLNTTQDYQNNHRLGAWPYKTANCLDSGGGSGTDAAKNNNSTATVRCDLSKAIATGSGAASAASADGVDVGHTTVDATTQRIPGVGTRSVVSSTSAGVSLQVPGVGVLHVGHVTASATTLAHGVDGSTSSSYTREVHGVLLTDPRGKAIVGPAACATTVQAQGGRAPVVHDSCSALGRLLTSKTSSRLRVDFPMPQSIATPKGAYAAIQQSDADYYQERTVDDQGVVYPHDSTAVRPMPAVALETYNDAAERSRVLTELAAVQGDSIFDTTAATAGSLPGGPPAPPASSPPPPASPSLTAPVPGAPTSTTPTAPVTAPVVAAPRSGLAGWLFIHRGLRDALLLAGTLALAAGAALLAARRQRLLTAMTASTERPSA